MGLISKTVVVALSGAAAVTAVASAASVVHELNQTTCNIRRPEDRIWAHTQGAAHPTYRFVTSFVGGNPDSNDISVLGAVFSAIPGTIAGVSAGIAEIWRHGEQPKCPAQSANSPKADYKLAARETIKGSKTLPQRSTQKIAFGPIATYGNASA